MFYCQAYHLAYFEIPLINGQFEAWVHGPVHKDVFDWFNNESFHYSDLSFDNSMNREDFTEDVHGKITIAQIEVLSGVLEHFKDWSGIELENLVRSEAPWKHSRGDLSEYEPSDAVIPDKSIICYYREFI